MGGSGCLFANGYPTQDPQLYCPDTAIRQLCHQAAVVSWVPSSTTLALLSFIAEAFQCVLGGLLRVQVDSGLWGAGHDQTVARFVNEQTDDYFHQQPKVI